MRSETGLAQGFDCVRRPAAADLSGDRHRRGAAGRRRHGGRGRPMARQRRRRKRIFLFLHLYEPHTPYAPPARFRERRIRTTARSPTPTSWSADSSPRSRDAAVRRRAHRAAVRPRRGPRRPRRAGARHLPLPRDRRVPLIVKLPRQAGVGRRVAAPVQHIDLVPTILDWRGAACRRDCAADRWCRSLGGAIPEQGLYAEALYSRFHFAWSELYALTDARYRFIRAPRDELYDIQNDPESGQRGAPRVDPHRDAPGAGEAHGRRGVD